MKYRRLYLIVSLCFLVPGIVSLFLWGLKPGIDFTGGSILEINTKNNKSSKGENESKTELPSEAEEATAESQEKEATLAGKPDGVDDKTYITQVIKNKEVELSSIQQSSEGSFILRTKTIDKNKKQEILEELEKGFGEIEEIRFETVGPTIGQELIKKTITAIFIAAGFIMFYVTSRFKDRKYGVCAILAMFHDTLILLGAFSLLGHFYNVEIDTLFVTAVLTILSFSVHDTVVVYDRIRESIKTNPRANFKDLVNKSVAETLTRSINNSMTIIFMLLCLYLLGGQTIKWFVFAFLVGTIAGTYSSTFTAAPLLILWEDLKKKKGKKRTT